MSRSYFFDGTIEKFFIVEIVDMFKTTTRSQPKTFIVLHQWRER